MMMSRMPATPLRRHHITPPCTPYAAIYSPLSYFIATLNSHTRQKPAEGHDEYAMAFIRAAAKRLAEAIRHICAAG